MNHWSKTILIYVCWLGLAILVYPLALAIPIAIHIVWNQIPITTTDIVSYTLLNGYGDRTVLYLSLYTALLGIGQQLLLKHLLSIRIRFWALGTFLGGTITMFILHTGQTPFGNMLNFAPWMFGFSIVQAYLLSRYTNWAWLWILAHLSIAGMFPIVVTGSAIELVLQWTIKAGIGGLVTMAILQIVVTRANATREKRKLATAS